MIGAPLLESGRQVINGDVLLALRVSLCVRRGVRGGESVRWIFKVSGGSFST